ncbi:uncharacterized protein LOC34618186 [Cyclospora cayetanensis]|uniref:Uncharacterized protein LOC34618186 n=1 Tax=Cyclospora cayetanensis TaxID=88456 RepID=A0A6P6RY83_9EIME|nr:uncharacterized protein LOC34618186 [Cyclospora cayetanensis]
MAAIRNVDIRVPRATATSPALQRLNSVVPRSASALALSLLRWRSSAPSLRRLAPRGSGSCCGGSQGIRAGYACLTFNSLNCVPRNRALSSSTRDSERLPASASEQRGKQTEETSQRSDHMEWHSFRAKGMDDHLQSWESEKRERKEKLERSLRLREIYKPAHLRRRKQKVKRVQQAEEQAPPVVAANFTEEAQTLSLIEDIHKAEVYQEICAKLQAHRPTLVNEFTDFENPYMLKRQALKRLLEERGTRNAVDESVIDTFLDRRPDLVKLRLSADLPPEVVEPLAAFHGLRSFSFDKRNRLKQKVDALFKAVGSAHKGLDSLLGDLEENQRSDQISKAHPFRNHFGFASSVPSGTVGSVTMGREDSGVDLELKTIRYPTLQRVAHSLPKDPKYREIVAHAIRVLERSKGWDFKDKLKAISTLIEVYNYLPPSATYERMLDKAFPVFRTPGMTRQTKSRNSVFCRGLKYIRSLTTQKPLSMRLAKKK